MKDIELIKQALTGKTIKDIDINTEYGDFCIGSITFVDGDILELFGESDNARICQSSTFEDTRIKSAMERIDYEYKKAKLIR